jgi:hypothetical protein
MIGVARDTLLADTLSGMALAPIVIVVRPAQDKEAPDLLVVETASLKLLRELRVEFLVGQVGEVAVDKLRHLAELGSGDPRKRAAKIVSDFIGSASKGDEPSASSEVTGPRG